MYELKVTKSQLGGVGRGCLLSTNRHTDAIQRRCVTKKHFNSWNFLSFKVDVTFEQVLVE